jgi:Skp family chaperone for outer membrane proteins
MFRINRFVSVVFLVVALTAAALAQAAPPKSVLINTAAFYDDKAGITKLISAEKQIDTEFAKDIKELQDGNATLTKIVEELQKTTVTAANQAALVAKKAEGESLQRRLELRKADIEVLINRKREALIGPITFDIGKAISEFGKKNNYGAIFDANKLAEAGILLFVGDGTDITKEFIAFFNARAASVPVK